MTASIAERIEALSPRLTQIAKQYASDPMAADDIFQHMVECILKQADPADSNSRILTLAQWRARNYIQSEKVYLTYVSDEGVLQGQGDGDEEQESAFDTYQAPDQSAHGVEDDVLDAEIAAQLQKLIDQLPVENQRLVTLLKAGNTPAEIARKLGVSRSAISQRIKQIRNIFEPQVVALQAI